MSGKGFRLEWRIAERWLEAGLDLLYPPRCAGCGRSGETWCHLCNQEVRKILSPLCNTCGAKRSIPSASCAFCRGLQVEFRARSYAAYEGPVARALLQLKYKPNRRLAMLLAGWLAALCRQEAWNPDLISAVPLGRKRLLQRGHNQAALLGRALARILDIGYSADILERVFETPSQVGLSREARWRNVRGAFRAEEEIANGKVILVVDDLYTTGSTVRACARSLGDAGAAAVLALTVARA